MLIFTETWLHPDIHTAELGMSRYNVFRRDRNQSTNDDIKNNKRRGGGVLIAVAKNIVSRQLNTKNVEIEQLFVMINTGKNRILLGNVYIPPKSDISIYTKHFEDIEILQLKYPKVKIIITGDYNLPNIIWNQNFMELTGIENAGLSTINKEVISMSNFINLTQLNKIENCNNKILDLVFSSDTSVTVVKSSEIILPVDNYHPPLNISVSLNKIPNLQCKKSLHNFNKADFNHINECLNATDWTFLKQENINENINVFYKIIHNIIEKSVPYIKCKKNVFPQWFNKDLIDLTLLKKKIHKKYKNSKSIKDYIQFNSIRRQCHDLSKNCYKEYLNNVENSIANNDINTLWKYSKSLKRNEIDIPASMFYNGINGNNAETIVNLFASFFKDVYDNTIDNSEIPFFSSNINLQISNIHIDINEIKTHINKLDIKKSSGPDKIPPILLKHCIHALSYPLYLIFNMSLSSGYFPIAWKNSYITPIFKKGDKCDIRNYRPVCIQSTIPKLFEKIILDKISFKLNGIITRFQHGFMKNRSTLTNLLIYENFIANAFADKCQVDSIYTDFSKAFDKVCHKILINKLRSMGITGNFLKWVESYLTNRQLFVKLNDVISDAFSATSGVPQGSHLGPILFILFINDIVDVFSDVDILLFADDLKLYKKIKNISDCIILQKNLNNLFNWCICNKLALNISKCQIIRFYKIKKPTIYEYNLDKIILNSVETINDLGIIFNSKLTFISHITNIINRAMKILGFIIRITKQFCNIDTIRILYITLVRSILEYNSTIWAPHYNIHIQAIEKVQHRFLRYINFKLGIPRESVDYNLLLNWTNLVNLSDRRKICDLLILYKIIHSVLDTPDLIELIRFHCPGRANNRLTLPFYYNNTHTLSHYYSPISRLHILGNEHANIGDIYFLKLAQYKHALKNYFSIM